MTQPAMLAEFAERDQSHQFLADVLAAGDHPQAECRENRNEPKPYQVWSGPEPR